MRPHLSQAMNSVNHPRRAVRKCPEHRSVAAPHGRITDVSISAGARRKRRLERRTAGNLPGHSVRKCAQNRRSSPIGFPHWADALGLLRIDHQFEQHVREEVRKACAATDVRGLPRLRAARRIEAAARAAIVRCFAEQYPKRRFRISRNWPGAMTIVTGAIAVTEVWLGLDWSGDEEGLEAINVAIDRGEERRRA